MAGWDRVALSAALVAIISSTVSTAQQPLFRAALAIRLVWADVDFGSQNILGQGVVLRGEPLLIDIGIINRYQGPPAAAEIDWPQRISGTLRRGGRFESDV